MRNVRLVLLAHGSWNATWMRPFEALAGRLERQIGSQAVRLAYLQFAAPALADVVAEATREGVDLRILPLFLAAGSHVDRDIPEQVYRARIQHPHVDIRLLDPVGSDPRMTALLETLALEAIGDEGRVRYGQDRSQGTPTCT